MAISRGNEKSAINFVHQNAIFTENVKKEMRNFKVYDSFTINLHNKKEVFRRAYIRSREVPTKKFLRPQTSSQEVGWITQPFIPFDKKDRLRFFPLIMSDMTRFMEYFWSIENKQKFNLEEKLPGET
ncbi:hypothetical protein NP493_663g00037 [Ridgeia piscesae]|uniref:Uncharacterized protein n=1 Tax=Ridgeia piscesae TaxID=27915 RepID=A0AAD9KRZ7_RIDPI|nr:hypothetical protein NP493_663g00037 [Ridgeia piscesae]